MGSVLIGHVGYFKNIQKPLKWNTIVLIIQYFFDWLPPIWYPCHPWSWTNWHFVLRREELCGRCVSKRTPYPYLIIHHSRLETQGRPHELIYPHSLQKSSSSWHLYKLETRTWHHCCIPWWRHQMETFSALLAICAWNSPVNGEFPAQRPVTRSFDVFLWSAMKKRLSKQWWGWWFETPSCPLWRHNISVNRARTTTIPTPKWSAFVNSQYPILVTTS